MSYYPYALYDPMPYTYAQPYNLAQETLTAIEPVYTHGLAETQAISYPHALKEAAAIGYLMGMGYDFFTANQIVDSWWKMGYQ